MASIYDEQIKLVLVDAESLFSLAQDAQIEVLPTLLLVKNLEIIDRFEGHMSVVDVKRKLNALHSRK